MEYNIISKNKNIQNNVIDIKNNYISDNFNNNNQENSNKFESAKITSEFNINNTNKNYNNNINRHSENTLDTIKLYIDIPFHEKVIYIENSDLYFISIIDNKFNYTKLNVMIGISNFRIFFFKKYNNKSSYESNINSNVEYLSNNNINNALNIDFPITLIKNIKYYNEKSKNILEFKLKDKRIFKIGLNQLNRLIKIYDFVNTKLNPLNLYTDVYAYIYYKEKKNTNYDFNNASNVNLNNCKANNENIQLKHILNKKLFININKKNLTWNVFNIKEELIRQGFYSFKFNKGYNIKNNKNNLIIKDINNNNNNSIISTSNKILDSLLNLDINLNRCNNIRHKSYEKITNKDINIITRRDSSLSKHKKQIEQPLIVSIVNDNYNLCVTYPKTLVFPCLLKDKEYKKIACLFNNNRLPIMTWYYKRKRSSLWICGNFKGLSNTDNIITSNLLFNYINAIKLSNQKKKVVIFDTRKYNKNAYMLIKDQIYRNKCEPYFLELDDPKYLRVKYKKLLCLSKQLDDNMYNFNNNINYHYTGSLKKSFVLLENSQWLNDISLILRSAYEVAQCLKSGKSVIIHGKNGYDRCIQISCLTQILLDPYYRKFKGFATLIEKEWLNLGHPFSRRYNNPINQMNKTNNNNNELDNSSITINADNKNIKSSERMSPVFTQFLDIVYQLILQFPKHFEFNDNYLLFINYHVQSCKYGTFLFNNDKDRINNSKNTLNIWDDIFDIIKNSIDKNIITKDISCKYDFINPFFQEKICNLNIFPNFSLYKLKIWEELYYQHIYCYNNTLNSIINNSINKFKFFSYQKSLDNKTLLTFNIKIYNYKNFINVFFERYNNIDNNKTKKKPKLNTILTDKTLKLINKILGNCFNNNDLHNIVK